MSQTASGNDTVLPLILPEQLSGVKSKEKKVHHELLYCNHTTNILKNKDNKTNSYCIIEEVFFSVVFRFGN